MERITIRLAIDIGTTLITGWSLMLAVGVIHHEWITGCPTIGYWWAVLLSGLVRAGLGITSSPLPSKTSAPGTRQGSDADLTERFPKRQSA